MKKNIILLITALNCMLQCAHAQFKAKIDERLELTSIAFALAGAQEYLQTAIPSYAKDIQEYFEPYKSSELIEYIKELRQTKSCMSYAYVPAVADMLEIKNGKITLQQQYDISKKLFQFV